MTANWRCIELFNVFMPSAILWVKGIMLPGRPCDGEGQISVDACLFAFAMSFL